jgi:hypothetical protein
MEIDVAFNEQNFSKQMFFTYIFSERTFRFKNLFSTVFRQFTNVSFKHFHVKNFQEMRVSVCDHFYLTIISIHGHFSSQTFSINELFSNAYFRLTNFSLKERLYFNEQFSSQKSQYTFILTKPQIAHCGDFMRKFCFRRVGGECRRLEFYSVVI